MVVLEAWSHGLPVLMTTHCNLPEGFRAGAALKIGTAPAPMLAGLDLLARLPEDERHTMGSNGQQLCRERFS